MQPWLVTGAAGFIGHHLLRRLIAEGQSVVGLDNLNPHPDSRIKRDRLAALPASDAFQFSQVDICDRPALADVFRRHRPAVVVNLAAQAGVRGSLEDPQRYVDSNVRGFMNILEECRDADIDHLIYASSSSVYGNSRRVPFSTSDPADRPVSVYAATKRADELLAHSHSHVYGLPTTGLRFFTVYGPWGRPDMAYFKFARAICSGEPVAIYGDGSALRDFTYIDDVIESVVRVAARPPSHAATTDDAVPWQLFNVGQGQQSQVNELITLLEEVLGRKALRRHQPVVPGDVVQTKADVSDLARHIDYTPLVRLDEGLARFAEWFKSYDASA